MADYDCDDNPPEEESVEWYRRKELDEKHKQRMGVRRREGRHYSGFQTSFGDTEEEEQKRREAFYRSLPYEQYLQTGHWQVVREKKLEQADFRCERCGSPRNLNVHHKTYKNLGKENIYDPDELVVLCESCHDRMHNMTG